MPDDNNTSSTEQRPAPPQDKVPPRGGCPRCGSAMSRSMFRTGSVEHPGGNVLVCPNCGSRQ